MASNRRLLAYLALLFLFFSARCFDEKWSIGGIFVLKRDLKEKTLVRKFSSFSKNQPFLAFLLKRFL